MSKKVVDACPIYSRFPLKYGCFALLGVCTLFVFIIALFIFYRNGAVEENTKKYIRIGLSSIEPHLAEAVIHNDLSSVDTFARSLVSYPGVKSVRIDNKFGSTLFRYTLFQNDTVSVMYPLQWIHNTNVIKWDLQTINESDNVGQVVVVVDMNMLSAELVSEAAWVGFLLLGGMIILVIGSSAYINWKISAPLMTISNKISLLCDIGENADTVEFFQNDRHDEIGLLNSRLYQLQSLHTSEQRKFLNYTEAIESAEKLYHNFFRNSIEGCFVIRFDGTLMHGNPALYSLLGVPEPSEDVVSEPLSLLALFVNSSDSEVFLQILIDKGQVEQFETKIWTNKGTMLETFITARLGWDTNTTESIIEGSLYDIGDKKKMTLLKKEILESEAANTTKDIFLANVSHEIRTPMNTILGMVDLLREADLAEEQKSHVQSIEKAGNILLHAVDDIIDLTSIRNGNLFLEHLAFDLSSVIKDVCIHYYTLSSRKGLEFTWKVDSDVPRIVMGDPSRLKQVLSCIVDNAVKFTDKGFVRIHVFKSQEAPDGDRIIFHVLDSGIGIDATSRSRGFDRFFQEDLSLNRLFGGNGLGLTLAKEILSYMGGEIWFSSQKHQGSALSFAVDLPRAEIPLQANNEVTNSSPREFDSGHALVVDDNPANQELVSLFLEELGFLSQRAEDGDEAVALFRANAYDVVFMDMQMPKLNGLEATRMIRDIEVSEKRSRTPILALSANAFDTDVDQAMLAGCDGYLKKPLRRQVLADMLQRTLSG